MESPAFPRSPGALWIMVGALVALYLAIRLPFLDQYVTVDEQWWLGWSANMYWGLRNGHLEQTFQFVYPGLPAMWAGVGGFFLRFPEAPEYLGLLPSPGDSIDGELRDLGRSSMDVLVAARMVKIVLQAVFFAISVIYLDRLCGRAVAFLSGMMIAFDPFVLGYDAILHADGMFAIVSLAAVLALADTISTERRGKLGCWALAGCLGALAWLSRTPGLLILAIAGIIVLVPLSKAIRSRQQPAIRLWLLRGTAYLAAFIATTLVVFPALVVRPIGTIRILWRETFEYTGSGAGLLMYFNGTIYRDGDPGWLYYPAVILWRSTPILLAGLLLFLVALALGWLRPLDRRARTALLLMGAFSGSLFLGMSVSAMKYDRYLIGLYPMLDVAAAIGFIILARKVATARWSSAQTAIRVAAALIIVVQVGSSLSVLPYRLDYYNPLLGGAGQARYELQMGWGQGSNQVVDWIDAQATPDRRMFMSGTGASSAYRFMIEPGDDDVVYVYPEQLASPSGWKGTDYFAVSIQHFQRQTGGLAGYLATTTPAFVALVEGVPHYRVYDLNTTPFPVDLFTNDNCLIDFLPGLQLLQINGSSGKLELYFVNTGDAPTGEIAIDLAVDGVDRDGVSFSLTARTTFTALEPGVLTEVLVSDPTVVVGIDADDYDLRFTLTETGDSVPMPATRPGDVQAGPSATVNADCYADPKPST